MNSHPVKVTHNNEIVSSSNPFPVDISSITYGDSHVPIKFAPTLTDAFSRLRVSQPITLFDSFHRYQDNGKITESINGIGANSIYDSNSSSIVMTVGATTGEYVYRETSRVFAYQPGKSLLILFTFAMSPAKSGLRQRQGYFNTSDGIYLQLNDSTLSFVKRSSTSGSPIDTVVEQANWNYDSLDGNGPSGKAIDITKTQICFIDIEWLGVGTVRTGFVIDGEFCLCHRFNHANILTVPYMKTACLPLRAEIANTGNTGSSSSYRLICSSVMSEGGYELRGKPRGISLDLIGQYILSSANTMYPVLSIRLKSTRLDAIVIPKDINLLATTTSTFKWSIIINSTISGGGAWVSAGSDSCVEYKSDGSSYSGGIVVKSGFFAAGGNSMPIINLDSDLFKFQLERNSFSSTAYTFTLAVAGSSNNDKVLAAIDWEEIT